MIITNARIFDGTRFIKQNSVEINKGQIKRVFSTRKADPGALDAGGRMLAPGLIDIHTHGMKGIDTLGIRNTRQAEELKRIYYRCGTTSFLAATMFKKGDERRLKVLSRSFDGVYLEGPLINPEKKGAIPLKYIWGAKSLKYYRGSAVVTVAPEMKGAVSLIKKLHKAGIIASLGHTSADYAQVKAGIKAGIRNVTHMYNAMEKTGEKALGQIKAALENSKVMIELISDGIHVEPGLLRMFYKLFGPDRIILITDSIGKMKLYGKGRLVKNIPMIEMARRMKKFTRSSTGEILKMCTHNPAKLLKMKKGNIKRGYGADFIITDNKLKLYNVIKAGDVVR